MMWWAIWCAVVVAGSVYAEAAPASNALATGIDWAQIDSSSPDDETLDYAVPSMGGRPYTGGAPWLYFLTDVPHDSQVSDDKKMIRSRRTLYVSVNPAVELLQREAYNHYLERQAQANRDFLNCIGKRVHFKSFPKNMFDKLIGESGMKANERVKRPMPSLSIDLPMSVLRHKLSLEKERKMQAFRAAANRNFLNDIGKRGFAWSPSVDVTLAELHEGRSRPKRKMPSLSINNPMEVLRQRLLLEVARKQMREAKQRQAVVNRVFLQNVGKRGFWANTVPSRYDN